MYPFLQENIQGLRAQPMETNTIILTDGIFEEVYAGSRLSGAQGTCWGQSRSRDLSLGSRSRGRGPGNKVASGLEQELFLAN